jgi:polyphosphate kinase
MANSPDEIRNLHIELIKWQNHVRETNTPVIVIFEGVDCAGKSSAIKRITEHLSPRASRVVALEKPTESEQREWFWTRYIREFPRAGEITFWDRSWYNRAGVEPVMNFCTRDQMNQFFSECPRLEKMWTQAGIKIVKFWFDIRQEEQQRRFQFRQTDPLKNSKLSLVDLASQSLWSEYMQARDRMFKQTHTEYAPWTIIDSNNKLLGRKTAMQHLLLKWDYAGRDLRAIGEINPRLRSQPSV